MTNLQIAAYTALQRREAIRQVRKAEASGCAKRVARAEDVKRRVFGGIVNNH